MIASKWASGRRLTDAQRARKRAVDRARNKQQRLSTLNRIAALEQTLQNFLCETPTTGLEGRIGTDNGALSHGMQDQANSDIREIQAESISSAGRGDTNCALTLASGDTVDISSLPSCWPSQHECSSSSPDNNSQGDSTYSTESGFQWTMGIHPPAPTPQLPKAITLRRGDIPSLWISEAVRSRNEILLMQAQEARKVEVCLDDQMNQDVLIRGVMEGWEVVKSRVNVCPLWEILRSIDHLLFWTASPVTRLVMLRMIHCMLLVSPDSWLVRMVD